MTPQHAVDIATGIGTPLMAGLGILAGVTGTCAWLAGKGGNNPGLVAWGKGGWLGAAVGAAATGLLSLINYVGSQFHA